MRIKIPLIGITLHWGSKDGGPESRVYMYGIECKRIASALVLRFEGGSREAYHSHAFNAISAVLKGRLGEDEILCDTPGLQGNRYRTYGPGWRPILTPRRCCHKVVSIGRTWVLTFRGPWSDTWQDIDATTMRSTTLTHGRRRVGA
jgi:hypothetical protein